MSPVRPAPRGADPEGCNLADRVFASGPAERGPRHRVCASCRASEHTP